MVRTAIVHLKGNGNKCQEEILYNTLPVEGADEVILEVFCSKCDFKIIVGMAKLCEWIKRGEVGDTRDVPVYKIQDISLLRIDGVV